MALIFKKKIEKERKILNKEPKSVAASVIDEEMNYALLVVSENFKLLNMCFSLIFVAKREVHKKF